MKNKLKIVVIGFVVLLIFYFFLPKGMAPVFAARDLDVDWGVSHGGPIFTVSNMLPGDTSVKSIDVTNRGPSPIQVKIKGEKTGGIGLDPKIETVLEITINDGSGVVYGQASPTGKKTLSDFFEESDPSGIDLGFLGSHQHRTYTFSVYFPKESGNEFQKKSVEFKLSFPEKSYGHIVINEVYYNVEKTSWKNHDYFHWDCFYGWGRYEDNRKKDDEWVELYNPTNKEISLKSWTLTDNHSSVTIHSNTKIKAHGFALITKDNDTWRFWDEERHTVKIELGRQIGDGLDNLGDHLILKDDKGHEVDRMSWGNDFSGFTPFGYNPSVGQGKSTQRNILGFDTNMASDFGPQFPPNPGR